MTSPAFPMHQSALLGITDALDDLAGQGFDLNGLDDMGWTPLHWACTGSSVETVVKLLKLGANPNLESADGLLPIHNAAQNALVDTMDVLIQGGTDITAHGGLVLEELEEIAPDIFTKQWIRKKGQDASEQQVNPVNEREQAALQRMKAKQAQLAAHKAESGPLPSEEPDLVVRKNVLLLAKHVNVWTVQEVQNWSTELRLSIDCRQQIQAAQLDGRHLLSMKTYDDWRKIGIYKFGDIRKLLKATKQPPFNPPATNKDPVQTEQV